MKVQKIMPVHDIVVGRREELAQMNVLFLEAPANQLLHTNAQNKGRQVL